MTTNNRENPEISNKDLQRISRFRLIDDDFMTCFFNQYPIGVELILRIIMQRPKLKVARMQV